MNRLPKKVSLVAQTASVIREEISNGRWERWLPGEHKLSSQLHVGRRTVRAALDQLCRDGVVKCYHGKRREIIRQGAMLKKPLSKRVVLLTPAPLHSQSQFGIFLIDRLRERLAEEGYLLEIHSGRVPYRAGVPQQLENLQETLNPAGWVLMQSNEKMQRWFMQRGLPCVIVGSCYPKIELPSVDFDYAAVCRHAVGQFLSKKHRRIVLLNPKSGAAGDLKGEEGFREAVQKSSSLNVHAEVVHHDGAIRDICARLDAMMRLKSPPTALVVSRAQHVLTVLGYLLSMGFRIPADVALISRDDDFFLENFVPKIARYSVNPDLFASKLSRVVLDSLHGEQAAVDHKIMPNFLSGQTLG
jgi:DNA-binding LacI/PurR family transcriptional regulator